MVMRKKLISVIVMLTFVIMMSGLASGGYLVNAKTANNLVPTSGSNSLSIVPSQILVELISTQKEFKLGTDAIVTLRITNQTTSDKEATLIMTLYDKQGKFIMYIAGKKTVNVNNPTDLTGMIKIPSAGEYKVRCFVWDNMNNMDPITNVIEFPVSN